jgi:hypothetical protein
MCLTQRAALSRPAAAGFTPFPGLACCCGCMRMRQQHQMAWDVLHWRSPFCVQHQAGSATWGCTRVVMLLCGFLVAGRCVGWGFGGGWRFGALRASRQFDPNCFFRANRLGFCSCSFLSIVDFLARVIGMVGIVCIGMEQQVQPALYALADHATQL